MLSTKVENVLPMVYDNVFGNYILFYLKIINIMMMLPPIINRVVISRFIAESIRLETFELMSVLVFVVLVVVVGVVVDVVVVVKGLSMPGSAVWVDDIGAY